MVFFGMLSKHLVNAENISNIFLRKIEINEELRFSNLFTQQKSVGVLLLEREKESIEELKMLKKETKTIKYCTLLFFVQ